jgi:hypothetical protein
MTTTMSQRAERWKRKLQEFRVTMGRWFGQGQHGRQPTSDDLVFSLLLALYSGAGEQDSALIVRDLNTMLRRDPEAVEFYLPQLCTYLALHNFSSEAMPLAMAYTMEGLCRRDLRLAHRINWHLRAFCAPSPATESMRIRVEGEGAVAASVLARRLRDIHFQATAASTGGVESNSWSQPQQQVALAPVDEGDLALYYPCMYFAEALAKVSEDLIGVDPSKRDEFMAAELARLNEYFLSEKAVGSGMIYVPFGSKYHKVRRVLPAESISFSTKERVPILVCLQVDSYDLDDVILMPGRVHTGQGAHAPSTGEENEMAKVFESFRSHISQGIATIRDRARRNMAMEAMNRSPVQEEELQAQSLRRRASSEHHLLGDNGMGQWAEHPDPAANQGVITRMKRAFSDSLRRESFGALSDDEGDVLAPESFEMSQEAGGQPEGESLRPSQIVVDGPEIGSVAAAGTRCENETGKTKLSPLLMSPSHMRVSAREPGAFAAPTSPLTRDDDESSDEESHEADELEDPSGLDDRAIERVRIKSPVAGNEHSEWVLFKERWAEKEERVRNGGVMGVIASSTVPASPRRPPQNAAPSQPRWGLLPIIVKANDDLRQEQAVSQLIQLFDRIFVDARVGVWLRPYAILATGPTSGLIEAVPDTVSLHALKRNAPGLSLDQFFKKHFSGQRGGLRQARENFCRSCAGYAIVCYLLQIKDRHNGNLLLDATGHLVHIDWGFVLGLSPGGNFGFETAPFKLTSEMVAVLGGPSSFTFQRFRRLCAKAFLEARRQREKIIMLVEMLAEGNPDLPCFSHAPPGVVVDALRARFLPNKTAGECVEFVTKLIDTSRAAWTTRLYDRYQKWTVGVLS